MEEDKTIDDYMDGYNISSKYRLRRAYDLPDIIEVIDDIKYILEQVDSLPIITQKYFSLYNRICNGKIDNIETQLEFYNASFEDALYVSEKNPIYQALDYMILSYKGE